MSMTDGAPILVVLPFPDGWRAAVCMDGRVAKLGPLKDDGDIAMLFLDQSGADGEQCPARRGR